VHDLILEAWAAYTHNHGERFDVTRDGHVNNWDLLVVAVQPGTRCER
jgi:hypothetical protein